MKYTHFVWDWNGTLLDDVEVAVDCVNDMLDSLGIKRTCLDEYYEYMDIPLQKYYAHFVDFDKYPYERCTEDFQRNYARRINDTEIFGDAVEVLDELKRRNAVQYIVSSFEETRLKEHVSRLGLNGYFSGISGACDFLAGEKHERAAGLLDGVDKKRVLFIGDTAADYYAARFVGCDCVLFCKGHQPKRILRQFGCPVIDNLRQVLTLAKS